MFAAIERLGDRVSSTPPPPPPPPPPEPPAARPPDPVRAVIDHVAWRIHEGLERQRKKEERRREKERLREERRRQREAAREHGEPIVGVAMIAAAGFLAYLAATGKPFWFAFIALGLFLGGASQLGRRKALAAPDQEGRRRPEETERAPASEPALSQAELEEAQRVDDIARQLIQEIEAGPKVLREMVEKPTQTVEGLRKGYHALAERERRLRARVNDQEQARLTRERAALVAKRDRAGDELTRARYDEALKALDLQRSELAALATAADQVEAERTRLRYTLEGLLAQVIRARSVHGADSAAGDAALKQSLERLSDEVGAVTEALEAVNTAPPPTRVR